MKISRYSISTTCVRGVHRCYAAFVGVWAGNGYLTLPGMLAGGRHVDFHTALVSQGGRVRQHSDSPETHRAR